MSRPQLTARPRDVRGKAVANLRKGGVLPAVVYGAGVQSQNISLDTHEFELLRRHAGRHAVIDLSIEGDGKAQPVLLQAIQEHPVSRNPLHVDLLVVNLEEERTVDVPLVFVGISEAVAKQGGVLLHLRDSVLVRCKPDDLPSGIEVDISPLVDFDSALHASDLVMPNGVTLVTEASEAIARVQQPRVEEETVVGAAEAAAAEEGAEPKAEGAEGGETASEENA
ncbi:MAG: large subunit ribosomal protein [Chloroflexota bacterium]|jgi:large subunit ribosomal protein L25|nr:large subunit ribosomal protein [Chloroflexota bacterium]